MRVRVCANEKKMSDRKKKKKGEETDAEIMAGLSQFIEQSKPKKKPVVMNFERDPFTFQRLFKSKYRPDRKVVRPGRNANVPGKSKQFL